MTSNFPVLFHSAGVPLAGTFIRPNGDFETKRPTVVVTGSWLTVKEQMPALYAHRLAALGYNAFIFDFAGFGQSDGHLRQAEMPERKIGDIHAAHAFVRTFSFVDPEAVGHLAICASAQYALRAIADGLPVKAFASVAGWFHDAASVKGFYGGKEGVALRMGRAEDALKQFLTAGKVRTVPAAKREDDRAGMSIPVPYYEDADRGAIPQWKNEMAEISWLYWLTYDGLTAAPRVAVPTLLVHGDKAVLPDNVKTIHERLAGPKQLVWSADGDQVDWYDRPVLVDRAVGAVGPWLNRYLNSAHPGHS